ncbi:MAG: hypothetical protein FJ279_04115 [Planctomycetes bacterium]|nr:hypothetical protein [Planctomycetota bacterium]
MPLLAVLACFAATAATLLTAQTFDHVVFSAAPAFCVLAYVFSLTTRRGAQAFVVALLSALGFIAAIEDKCQFSAYGPIFSQNHPLQAARAGFIRGDAQLVKDTEGVADCVKALTSPKDSVFVGCGNVMIYFLAERKFDSPQFQTNKYPIPAVKEVFLRDLQRAQAAVLLTKPVTPADLGERDEARRYVLEHFTPVKQFGDYEVYVRRR